MPDPNILSELSPWNLQFRQIRAGCLEVRVSMIQLANVGIMDFHSNLGLHQIGAGPKDNITIGIPLAGSVPRWREVPADPGALLSFGSGVAFEGTTGNGFRGLTFSISGTYYSTICKKIGVPDTSRAREFGLLVNAESSRRQARLAGHVLDAFARKDSAFTAGFEDEVVSALILSIAEVQGQNDDKSPPKVRTAARRRALEVMECLAPEAARISDICEQSGVAWRTLNRAFLEYFGVGPKTYYEMLRLWRVREELMLCGPDKPVSETANRWGFWHMGKFARDYRRMFHELPSQTRARCGT